MSTIKLSSSALLVNLSISLWSGRKLDKSVSQEIDAGKHTKTRAGNYHKNLFAGSTSLESIQKIAGEIRTWHYTVTQPWGDNGDRLLNAKLLNDYKKQLDDFEEQFSRAVDAFLREYKLLISQAAFTLGDLFNITDYPAVEDIEHKFGFKYEFTPLPESGDFRVDIGQQGLNELQASYEAAIKTRIDNAMKDAWDRTRDVLTRMSERLADNDKGENKIFRDTLVTNATDLCGLLRYFNVTNDVALHEACIELENALKGVDAKTLRDSDSVRRGVKARVDSILDKFNV